MPCVKPISPLEFQKISDDTVTRMIEYTKPFLTPISKSLSKSEGEHLGTGAYIELDDTNYLITNEHVAKYITNDTITHKFYESNEVLRLAGPALVAPAPLDVALIEIPDSSWNLVKHSALSVPFDRFATKHNPAIYELLYFVGFSSERSKFYFNHLFNLATPYLTQEVPFPEGINGADPNYHFSLPYPPDLARSIDGKSHLPDPHGFSGSLVWDTKRIACLSRKIEWKPEMAQVTGIVWGWPSSAACILVTKVEHLALREIISQLREMAKNVD